MNLNFGLQSLLNRLLIGGVYNLIAIGLTLIFGVIKMIKFASGAGIMPGMCCTYWLIVLLKDSEMNRQTPRERLARVRLFLKNVRVLKQFG